MPTVNREFMDTVLKNVVADGLREGRITRQLDKTHYAEYVFRNSNLPMVFVLDFCERYPLADESLFVVKAYMTIEVPESKEPKVGLAIGRIVEFATKELHAIGVDPVRIKHHAEFTK